MLHLSQDMDNVVVATLLRDGWQLGGVVRVAGQ